MRTLFTAMVWLLAIMAVTAQDITITVDAPETVAAGERFRIIYTINSTGGQFTPPEFDRSFTVQGPQQSTSRNVQWINGEMKSVSSTTLIYYVTVYTPGTYQVAPARFEAKKLTVSSRPLEIVVTDGGGVAAQGRQQVRDGAGEVSAPEGSDLFIRLLFSKREVYAGEPVTVALKLYSRTSLSGIQDLSYPDFKGFLREEIETPPLRSLDNEVIDGREYGTGTVQRFVLYPQIAGEITIDPVEMTLLVQERTGGRDPFFDDPFFSGFFSSVSNVPRKVVTPPVTIRVKALPAPRPADFHGAVGSYTIESSLSSVEAEVNEAVTLTVKLTGSGNLTLAGEPVIHFPQGIERYDPKVTLRSSGTAAGSKLFEYLLIPRNSGTFELPPVSYAVFDPRQERYLTLRTEGYRLHVTGVSGSDEATLPLYGSGEEMKILGHDIRFIRNGKRRLATTTVPMVESLHYWLWFVAALFIAVMVLLLRREQIRRNADVARLRSRKASRNARRRLARASALLRAGKSEMVNAEVARALWGYLGDKLRMAPSELTREKCYAALREQRVDEELIGELEAVLSATEYSQYAPDSGAESPDALCRRATELTGRLDSVLN